MSIKHAAAPVCVVTTIIALVASWGQVRTNAEGLALIGNAEHCINTYFRGHEMSDNTFSAMKSAVFTTGCYGLRTYKGKDGKRHEAAPHKLTQQGKWREMCERLPEFNNGGKYPGLTKRREAERRLCLKSP